MYTIKILQYNNYFNRAVKKFDNIEDYDDAVLATFPGVNFLMADGVNTEQIINYGEDSITPDYLLAINEYDETVSRWFIIEADRLRNHQFRLTLKRDVLADNWDVIRNAPCFVQKAYLRENDKMIFNDEGMIFNQIKKGEHLLNDKTNCAWVVGYIPHDYNDTAEKTIQATQTTSYQTITLDEEYVPGQAMFLRRSVESWKISILYKMTDSRVPVDLRYIVSVNNDGSSATPTNSLINLLKDYNPTAQSGYVNNVNDYSNITTPGINHPAQLYNRIQGLSSLDSNINALGFKASSNYIEDVPIDDQLSWGTGKIVTDQDNNQYEVEKYSGYNTIDLIGSQVDTTMVQKINNIIASALNGTYNYNVVKITVRYKEDYLILRRNFSYNSYKFSMPSMTNRTHTLDAPYDMFCMPLGDMYINPNGGGSYLINGSLNLSLANFLSTAIGRDNLYDIQLLPYCPIQDAVDGNTIRMNNNSITFIQDANSNNVGVMLWCEKSNFTFDITYPILIENKKIQSQTDIWRLCSPNYNGLFEFSAVKNDGVDSFNVDCTYKPYAPYIHVNPNFKGLYGDDYNDARGLICGGDFSLPILNDAFTDYEVRNKNYQNIFDRQIQNMDKMHTLNLIESIGTGLIGGIGNTAGMGLLAGLPGAIGGGIASGVGLAADTVMNNLAYKEQKSYTTDLYKYQLGNIEALPYSISKTSAITYNNKLFPFVEWYSCTEEEKNALIRKLEYNGMTVNRIGTIDEFITEDEHFFQGVIIRLPDLKDDYHVAVEIADRVKQGIFIKEDE